MGKMFVDASGDADLLFRAGAPCKEKGNTINHWSYEMDMTSLKRALEENDIKMATPVRWVDMLDMAEYRGPDGKKPPEYHGTTSEDVNEYIRISRKLAREFFKENDGPDFTQLTLPMMPQFRTTRRLDGKAVFDPAEGEPTSDSSVGCMIFSLAAPAKVYEFPYECLIDRNISNIAAAGRIVSAENNLGWEIIRFIPACALSGQAAGTAAALAATKQHCSLQELDVKQLQETLSQAGVKVHMSEEMRQNQDKKPLLFCAMCRNC